MPRILPALLLLALPVAALADGLLPPYPYRYLHPPAGLTYRNKPPVSQIRVIPADFLRALRQFSVFTNDGQAGVSGGKGTLALDRSATAAVLRISPVDAPPGLPSNLALDGNAYRIAITGDPGGRPARLLKPVRITLRWPHDPINLYLYRAGVWRRICSSATAVVAAGTITCPATSLGVFAAVTLPSNVPGVTAPERGFSKSVTWVLVALVGMAGVALAVSILKLRRRRRGV